MAAAGRLHAVVVNRCEWLQSGCFDEGFRVVRGGAVDAAPPELVGG
jgi:hypothetical protein